MSKIKQPVVTPAPSPFKAIEPAPEAKPAGPVEYGVVMFRDATGWGLAVLKTQGEKVLRREVLCQGEVRAVVLEQWKLATVQKVFGRNWDSK